MNSDAFETWLQAADLAPTTIQTRLWVLSTLEKKQEVDLDAEYARDGLSGLMHLLSYSSEDAAQNRPNPTNMTIDPKNLKGRLSWYRSHLKSYIQFLGGQPLPEPAGEDEETSQAIEVTFGLEKDMQRALRLNLSQLEPGLQEIDSGVERKVDGGSIDILARDAQGKTVVIEIKSVASKPDAVAQVLHYMGAIAEEDGLEEIRGYLIAADHPKRVKWAAKAVPNLELRIYRINFGFEAS